MSERRRALGRGLGALIPSGPTAGGATGRPVDVFFPENSRNPDPVEDQDTEAAQGELHPGDQSAASAAPGPDTATATDLSDAPDVAPGDHAGQETATSKPENSRPAREPQADENTRADPSTTAAAVSPTPEGDPDLVAVPGARFAEVPLTSIQPNAQQPRQVFDEDELEELASSIREVGVLQPVIVRATGTDEHGEPHYELIMGERRWRASELAGQVTVPAIIREAAQEDMLRDALLENLHRAQLNPLEEAAAYQQLLDDFHCTHDELAVRIARSRPQISNTLRLLKLPPLVQRRVAAGVLSAGHARALLGLSDGAAMERMAQRIVAEGLSVRATEELITLGEDPMQPEMRRRPRAGEHSPALDDLASRLSDQLDTKVKVNLGQRKGRINIEFASVQDLNRILNVLAPKDPGVFPPAAEGRTDDGIA